MNYDKLVETIQGIPGAVPVYRGLKRFVTTPRDAVRSARAVKRIQRGDYAGTSYYDLYSMHDTHQYLRLLKEVHRTNEERIREKEQRGEQVKIAFQASFLATWIGDAILDRFADDDRFEVTVVLVWQTNTEKREIALLQEHFKGRKERVVFADGSVHPGDFDVVFYTSPYLSALENWGEKEVPLSTLVCHVPYGFFVAQRQMAQYNLFIHGIVWRNYGLSGMDVEMAKKYCRIGDYGMVFSGYPKMDGAYDPHCADAAEWKIPERSHNVKKIIYAPHHSINADPYYSTFAQNKDFMLQYAREHIQTTAWVYKPHPLLRIQAVKTGVFRTETEYNSYVDEWRSLPNAVVLEGQYLPYMASSDALILDSASFLAEYMYCKKPLLFLTRRGEAFNETGQLLMEHLYSVPGDDFNGIRHFVESTIDEDPKAPERDVFFQNYLDYYSCNGLLATEFIYQDVVNTFTSAKWKNGLP